MKSMGGLGQAFVDPDGKPWGATHTRNAMDVVLNDSITPTVIGKMSRVTNSTALAVGVEHSPSAHEYTIVVDDATGASVGSYITLFNPTLERFSFYTALAVVSNTITLDSPIDASFPVGTYVDIATTDMSVDGSVVPVTFGLRGTGAPPGVDMTADVTRIIVTCYTSGVGDLGDFGDIAGGLTRGLLLRRRNGATYNIFNVKTNGELAGITMDFDPYAASNPNQGVNGFVSRLTFSGQDKLGVVIRLEVGEDLELIVQDDLTSLISLEIIAEGSLTSGGQI